LAENADFAQMCEDNEILFIGPKPAAIRTMGDKATARETVRKAGVPVIPGSPTTVDNIETVKKIAEQIGYPIILKATAGGGGRGMRIVRQIAELENAYATAREEALKAFGNAGLYVEKLVEDARHIEFQIIGDNYGNIIHLGERECSIQRRHQKLIEESPSPALNNELREKMGRVAIRAAKAVNYSSAGTIEFLFDNRQNFYFMEMNTRIQVEHPVTEMVTGIDLLKEQICLADGAKIPKWMKKFSLRGHAIECRLNAEDPTRNFLPAPGQIQAFHAPGGLGVRMDTHVYAGYTIPPYYDSLLGKLITHGRDRAEALQRMQRALEETIIEGIPTTVAFHQAILAEEAFRSGAFNINFLNTFNFNKT